jgi:hypothetical protein
MKIYVCGTDSSSRTTHMEPAPVVELEANQFVRGNDWLSAKEVTELWTPLTFEIRGLGKKNAVVRDAYSAFMQTGMRLVVSERSREAIDQHFPGECTFLPITVKNADVRFHALWPNRCATDALDESASAIKEYSYGLKSVSCYRFLEARLGGLNFFSLSPNYSGVGLMVTEAVANMVRDLGLIGFTFWDRSCDALSQRT